MKRLSKMTYQAVVCLSSFALIGWCSIRATTLLKETNLTLYTVHSLLLKLLVSKSDLTKKIDLKN